MKTWDRHDGAALGRYLDGELSPAERRAVEAHLESCGRCRDEVEAMRALRATWRALPGVTSTPQDRAAIVAAAAPLLEAGRRRGASRAPWWAAGGAIAGTDVVSAGALAAGAVLLAVLLAGEPGGAAFRPRSATVRTLAERSAHEAGRELGFAGRIELPDPFGTRAGQPAEGRSR